MAVRFLWYTKVFTDLENDSIHTIGVRTPCNKKTNFGNKMQYFSPFDLKPTDRPRIRDIVKNSTSSCYNLYILHPFFLSLRTKDEAQTDIF